MRPLVLLPLLLLFCSLAEAREYSPRVVSPHRADAYSMTTFRDFHRWRDLSGDELANGVYFYRLEIGGSAGTARSGMGRLVMMR